MRTGTLLSKIIIRNFCACTQKSSTSLLRICVYAQKNQQMIIIKSSNNPLVDVLRPAQKLQVWNTYIPGPVGYTTDTVRAPNIAHLSLLTSVGYNKKETKLKKCAQPNKVIIIYYLYRVKNEKYFPNL